MIRLSFGHWLSKGVLEVDCMARLTAVIVEHYQMISAERGWSMFFTCFWFEKLRVRRGTNMQDELSNPTTLTSPLSHRHQAVLLSLSKEREDVQALVIGALLRIEGNLGFGLGTESSMDLALPCSDDNRSGVASDFDVKLPALGLSFRLPVSMVQKGGNVATALRGGTLCGPDIEFSKDAEMKAVALVNHDSPVVAVADCYLGLLEVECRPLVTTGYLKSYDYEVAIKIGPISYLAACIRLSRKTAKSQRCRREANEANALSPVGVVAAIFEQSPIDKYGFLMASADSLVAMFSIAGAPALAEWVGRWADETDLICDFTFINFYLATIKADLDDVRSEPQVAGGPGVAQETKVALKPAASPHSLEAVSDHPTRIVLAAIGDATTREGISAGVRFAPLLRPLPLLGSEADADFVYATLRSEFPWMTEANEAIASSIAMCRREGAAFKSPPLLLLGPPGVGKTRWARRAAEVVGVGFKGMSLAGVRSSLTVIGSDRGYLHARPGFVVYAFLDTNSANPMALLDEVDKIGDQEVADSVLPFLEYETSKKLYDIFLLSNLDVSAINWILTANKIDGVGQPLLDRVRILTVGRPTVEQALRTIPALARDVFSELGLDPSNAPDLSYANDRFKTSYATSKSIRSLRAEVALEIGKQAWSIPCLRVVSGLAD